MADDLPPGTMTRLVRDLERKPQNALRDELLSKARAGYYHDFKAEFLVTPKVTLDADLRRFGYEDLARKCRHGEYDETPSDEDIERLIAEVGAESSLGRAMRKTHEDRKKARS